MITQCVAHNQLGECYGNNAGGMTRLYRQNFDLFTLKNHDVPAPKTVYNCCMNSFQNTVHHDF